MPIILNTRKHEDTDTSNPHLRADLGNTRAYFNRYWRVTFIWQSIPVIVLKNVFKQDNSKEKKIVYSHIGEWFIKCLSPFSMQNNHNEHLFTH